MVTSEWCPKVEDQPKPKITGPLFPLSIREGIFKSVVYNEVYLYHDKYINVVENMISKFPSLIDSEIVVRAF